MGKIEWHGPAEKRAEALVALRLERNRLLRESDWTQMLDSPLSAEEQAAARDYRQSLRDLPQAVDPARPSWPMAPVCLAASEAVDSEARGIK